MATLGCTLKYGEPIPVKSEYFALNWRARPVVPNDNGKVDVERLFSGIEGKGVYCVEGRHDAHPHGAVLYIGQAAASGCEASLRARMRASFSKFQERGVLYSDIHDLIVRWAPVTDEFEKHIDHIESLLIVAHAPPFNAQEVRRWYTGPPNLVVLNAGAKGRLHPTVAAIYHCEEGWPPDESFAARSRSTR